MYACDIFWDKKSQGPSDCIITLHTHIDASLVTLLPTTGILAVLYYMKGSGSALT